MSRARNIMWLAVVGWLALHTTPTAANQHDANDTPYVEVWGEATIEIPPDTIVWSITLSEEQVTNLEQAREAVRQRMDKLLDLKEELKIPDEDFETGQLKVGKGTPDPRRVQGSQAASLPKTVYSIRRQITIRQRDLNRFDTFLNALFEAEDFSATYHLQSSKAPEAQAEAEVDAVRNARERAQRLAEGLDAKAGRVIRINGFQGGWHQARRMPVAADMSGFSGVFMPGQLEVSSRVQARFELIHPHDE